MAGKACTRGSVSVTLDRGANEARREKDPSMIPIINWERSNIGFPEWLNSRARMLRNLKKPGDAQGGVEHLLTRFHHEQGLTIRLSVLNRFTELRGDFR